MIRKLLLLLAFACLIGEPAFAKSKKNEEAIQSAEAYKKTGDYIWATGHGKDAQSAYNSALSALVMQISQTVQLDITEEIKDGVTEDGRRVSSDMFSSVLKSYTTPATLEGLKSLVLSDGPDYETFVFMPVHKIEEMQKRRREHVAELARTGIRARENGKIDDALKNLYRSYVLLHSLPHPSDFKATVDGEERVLKTWLPEAMSDIVGNLDFKIAKVESDPETDMKTVELTVKYRGNEVNTITFRHATANGFSHPISGRSGMAQFELDADPPVKHLKLYVEYLFRDENHSHDELQPLLEAFNAEGLVNNEFTVSVKSDKKEAKVFQQLVAAGAHENVKNLGGTEASPYATAMERIISAISSKNFNSVKEICTDDGWMLFDRLMNYGKVKILGNATPDTYSFYPYRGEVMCRSVPMSFTFGNGSAKRTFTEEVTFTFDSDARLVSVGLGLGNIARKDIFSKQGAAWTDEKKMDLVNFLENYRTAFALRQLDYIESIFDDDAVIITGHVTKGLEKVKSFDGGFVLASKEHIKLTEYNKKEYLNRLRRTFDSQEYINVSFTDTDVERSGVGGETYSIQLQQDYVSKTYGDQGYLFLFLDFNDPEKPLIHVRTWQPERSPDLTPNLPPDHPRAGIFSPVFF